MLALITSEAVIKTENIPETLLFDARRLLQMQSEFSNIVNGATMLTMTNHALVASDRQPSETKRQLFKQVLTYLEEQIASGSDSDTIIEMLCEKLDSVQVLTESTQRDNFLKALKAGITNKSDNVRKLM
jgi:uncharacterized protein with von Willebrand factor type A (vWA) domain